MKSIIRGAFIATAVAACLTINVQAKSITTLPATVRTVAIGDTGKMEKMKMSKMKMSKMKMAKDSMKMKKSKMKMAKDSTGKM